MESDVEIPRGLIRSWKMWMALAVVAVLAFLIGTASGHSYARVETKEVRIEVPWPDRCTDVMIKVSGSDKSVSCPNPDHHGRFEMWGAWNDTYLFCSCPNPQINLEAGAR